MDGTRLWFQVKDLVAHHFIGPNFKVKLKNNKDPRDCRLKNIIVVRKKTPKEIERNRLVDNN